jgi:hypothetical protein
MPAGERASVLLVDDVGQAFIVYHRQRLSITSLTHADLH